MGKECYNVLGLAMQYKLPILSILLIIIPKADFSGQSWHVYVGQPPVAHQTLSEGTEVRRIP